MSSSGEDDWRNRERHARQRQEGSPSPAPPRQRPRANRANRANPPAGGLPIRPPELRLHGEPFYISPPPDPEEVIPALLKELPRPQRREMLSGSTISNQVSPFSVDPTRADLKMIPYGIGLNVLMKLARPNFMDRSAGSTVVGLLRFDEAFRRLLAETTQGLRQMAAARLESGAPVAEIRNQEAILETALQEWGFQPQQAVRVLYPRPEEDITRPPRDAVPTLALRNSESISPLDLKLRILVTPPKRFRPPAWNYDPFREMRETWNRGDGGPNFDPPFLDENAARARFDAQLITLRRRCSQSQDDALARIICKITPWNDPQLQSVLHCLYFIRTGCLILHDMEDIVKHFNYLKAPWIEQRHRAAINQVLTLGRGWGPRETDAVIELLELEQIKRKRREDLADGPEY